MADSRLVAYIQEQLRNGFSAATIKNALIQNNYPLQEIEAAFQAIGGVSQQQMQQLTAYLKQNLAKGYSAQQLQQYLFQQGYSPHVVSSALKQATRKPTKILFVIFLILLIIGVVAAAAWLYLNIEQETPAEISFSIGLDVDTVAPGDTLYIRNDFLNFPLQREYPMTIYYTITDEYGTEKDSWQTSMGITDALIKNTKQSISRYLAAGLYTLTAQMNYGSTSKQAAVQFTVSADEEKIAQAEQRAEETPPETVSVETTEEPEIVETASETAVSGQDDYVNLAHAKEIAVTDPASAIHYCDMISTQTKIDECYWNVAKLSGDKSYCEKVIADHTRDACWIGFAFDKNDYSVCENIANPFIKQSCDQLKKVAELKAMQQ
jgi:hypothetical protein